MALELGLDTFGDRTFAPTGELVSHAQAIRDVVEQGVLADQLGLAFIGVGEHHRDDFAVSAPEVVLAAIAARTRQIRLGSAVTVLSTDDPVRVFQRFSTVDAVSNGRAEVILGRGSFTESFPLFGYSLSEYEPLFDEKVDLFAAVQAQTSPVTWSGQHRPPLEVDAVYPPIETGRLRTWIGVGGTPQSVLRAAHYGFPLMLAIIGGPAQRFVPFVDLYRRAMEERARPVEAIGVHSPGHVAETDEQAREELWPHYLEQRARIGKERGWPPPSRAQFDQECAHGALYCGSPETVATKIAATAKLLGLTRFDLKYSNGRMPHAQLLRSIELLGTRVQPRVRELLAAG